MKRAALWRRLRAAWRLGRSVEVWYHPASTLLDLAQTHRVTHVDVERSERVLDELMGEGLLDWRRVRRSHLASAEELLAFHAPSYLEETTDPPRLARIFGVDPQGFSVQRVLVAQRWAVGATLDAARAVVAGPARIAFHLGGGFHHAEPEQGSGFCVYNDIGVAIACLRREGFDAPIAIVDLDYHQGNGQLVAFARDSTVLTYDVQGSVWSHVDAVAHVNISLPDGVDDAAYCAKLDETLAAALRAHQPALVFYVAGNDVLAGDRLGSFALSPAGVLARDRRVVDAVAEVGASLVVTMGGGYSAGAWRATTAFLRWLLCGAVDVAPATSDDLRVRFTRIAGDLDPKALRGDDPFNFDLREVFADMGGAPAPKLLLDYYTPSGVEYAFEQYGFLDKIRNKGFRALSVECDFSAKERQLVRVYGESTSPTQTAPRSGSRRVPLSAGGQSGAKGARHLLVEIVVSRRREPAPDGMTTHETLDLLGLEWLLLQDPTASFSLERPRLPGQEYPGLGVALELQEMLVQVCRRLGLEGVWHRPSHYHVARVGTRQFRFSDPRAAGRMLALRALLDPHDLAGATRWIEEGRVLVGGRPLPWEPRDMVLPVSARLVEFFASEAYRSAVKTACDAVKAEGLELRMPPPLLG